MNWQKRGRIFHPKMRSKQLYSHAAMPTPYLTDDFWRIFFYSRNHSGISQIFFLDFEPDAPEIIKNISEEPVLSVGKVGAFDDNGVQPMCLVENEGLLCLYYMGLSPGVTVPTRNNSGLAVSDDAGFSFKRAFDGPILDRNLLEPHSALTPWVLKSSDKWRCWYSSVTEWVEIDGRLEALFEIKYAYSDDGINWVRNNHTCIVPSDRLEVACKPNVIKYGDVYCMWFSVRSAQDFRTGKNQYRIGYAESRDGLVWTRDDSKAGISPSETGWDSEMLCFSGLSEYDGRWHLFYSGNGFGKCGFGYATKTPEILLI